jgi:NAD(P)-dependent dehydrogenase (short-subunit alcohol dehydrogenase family)
MDVRNLAGKTALVTGAASGIGRETALALARAGADLFLCDLDEAGLKAIEGAISSLGRNAVCQRADVSKRDEMGAFADAVHREVEAVDVLVNNAGVAVAAGWLEMTVDDWDWITGINLGGVFHGCHFFVPRMVQRGRGGHVVNIASMAGFVAGPPLSAYSATKAAVMSLSESLRAEVARHGIGVTAVCPGLINTQIPDHMRYRGLLANAEARARAKQVVVKRNYGPDRVARNILKAIQRNRAIAPVSIEARLAYYLKRFVPGFVRWFVQFSHNRSVRNLEAEAQGPSD